MGEQVCHSPFSRNGNKLCYATSPSSRGKKKEGARKVEQMCGHSVGSSGSHVCLLFRQLEFLVHSLWNLASERSVARISRKSPEVNIIQDSTSSSLLLYLCGIDIYSYPHPKPQIQDPHIPPLLFNPWEVRNVFSMFKEWRPKSLLWPWHSSCRVGPYLPIIPCSAHVEPHRASS
jgi:hypothetical protein